MAREWPFSGRRSFPAERKAGEKAPRQEFACKNKTKLEGRHCGWSSALRGKEAGDTVGERTAEARTYRGLTFTWPVRKGGG